MNSIKDKTFIICIPGRVFSSAFLLNLVDLLGFIGENGGLFKLSFQYSPVINISRCKCLMASVEKGKNQKPFDGLKYDYILWIDSDIIFNSDSFVKLLEMQKDIACGWYAQSSQSADGSLFSTVVEKADDLYFKKNKTYKFMTVKNFLTKTKPFTVDHVGLGWVLVKQGVFESLEYPWFAPKLQLIGEMQDVCSEDIAFCKDVQAAGYDIWVDPTCRVGHEKTLVI